MTTAKTHIAIKVLKSINECHEPNAADVEVLRSLYPDYPNAAPAELACRAIIDAVEAKKPKPH